MGRHDHRSPATAHGPAEPRLTSNVPRLQAAPPRREPWNPARAVAVVLAELSMLANFVWLPYQPVWSITLIVIDGFIIWALCAPRREARP
ncbi:DUF7144 family membrane protein [Streptomyces phyllanthi]|uniref:DUF7144 domain-containing protein n=1 Tax=Streptomyces phyllanthi TaxID=1803180 RepID=A0A5N8VXS4_9ACTN|nr:hypothetical protein [Streptomyces phyllanthi]